MEISTPTVHLKQASNKPPRGPEPVRMDAAGCELVSKVDVVSFALLYRARSRSAGCGTIDLKGLKRPLNAKTIDLTQYDVMSLRKWRNSFASAWRMMLALVLSTCYVALYSLELVRA